MKNEQSKQFRKNIVLASVFTALITVLTFYIRIPSHNGYIHLGDSMIYLAACLLPPLPALLCASLAGMFADALGGYIIYIIPTLIIKALISLPFSSGQNKFLTKHNLLAVGVSSVISVVGYYIAEVLLVSITSANGFRDLLQYIFSSAPWISAVYCIPGNVTQALGSAIVFILIAVSLDKIKIKDKI